MANRNLGYDIDVGYDGASSANQAIGDLEKFNTELGNVEQAAEEVSRQTGGMFDKATSSWTEFSSAVGVVKGALSGVQQVAQQAWDTIERGANLDRVTGQAEALAGSIGTSWNTLLADMTDATAGMISQADLTASAVDIIGLGMAGTGDEVVRLSRLVGELGWDMQTLTLTLANQSTARLDSLGLSMTDVTDKVKVFTAAGMDASEAFSLAVLEAGEEKLELLGSAADTAAGDLMRLETAWTDLVDRIAKGASEGAAPLAFIALGELAVAEAIDKGIISQKQWSQAQGEAVFTGATYVETLGRLVDEIEAVEDAERNTSKYNQTITQQRIAGTQAVLDEADAMRELLLANYSVEQLSDDGSGFMGALYDQSIALAEAAKDTTFTDTLYSQSLALTELETAHQDFATNAVASWKEYIGNIQSTAGDAFTAAAFDPDQTYDAAQSTYDIADAHGADARALDEMGRNLGIINEEQSAYALSVAQSKAIRESLAQAVNDEIISWGQYEEAVIAASNAVKGIEAPEVATVAPVKWSEADLSGVVDGSITEIKTKFGDAKTWEGIGTSMQGAIDAAVTVGKASIGELTSPADAFEIVMGWNDEAITTGVDNSKDKLNELEDKTVTVTFAAVYTDEFENAIDEID